jgi:hypothetical protein
LEAKGEKRWLVRFNNGLEKECPSVTLKMLGDPRNNSAAASAPVLTSAPVASAPVLASAPVASAPVLASAPEALAPTAVALMASAPILVTSAPVASAPTAVAPEASAPVLVALAPVASAPTAVAPEASAPVLTLTPAASDPTALAPAASAPVLASVISEINQVAVLPNIENLNAASNTAPMEDENADLMVDVEDEAQQENEEDAGFDVVENITLDVYQQQRQECESKKLELIESNWCVTSKSSNVELVWRVAPESIPECPPEEFSSLGVRNINWEAFTNLSSIIKKSKTDGEAPQPFLDLFLLLWPGDLKQQLAQMNEEILKENKMKSKNKVGDRSNRPVTPREFFIFIGIIIFSGAVGKGGKQLFEKQCDRQKEGVFHMSPTINLTPYMAMRQFKDINTCFSNAFADFHKKTCSSQSQPVVHGVQVDCQI